MSSLVTTWTLTVRFELQESIGRSFKGCLFTIVIDTAEHRSNAEDRPDWWMDGITFNWPQWSPSLSALRFARFLSTQSDIELPSQEGWSTSATGQNSSPVKVHWNGSDVNSEPVKREAIQDSKQPVHSLHGRGWRASDEWPQLQTQVIFYSAGVLHLHLSTQAGTFCIVAQHMFVLFCLSQLRYWSCFCKSKRGLHWT